jgi:two-component system chemotaxis sensor kinase CheA
MQYSDVSKELLLGFLDESIDALSEVDHLFIELEKQPHNKEIINAIFRPIHSLKGNAAYFGLMRLKKFAHAMENLLDQLRKEEKKVDSNIINVLLPGMDLLREILINVREERDEITDEKRYSSLFNQIDNTQKNVGILSTSDIVSGINESITELRKTCNISQMEIIDKVLVSLSKIPLLSSLKQNGPETINSNKVDNELKNTINEMDKKLSDFETNGVTKESLKSMYALIDVMKQQCKTSKQLKIVTDIIDIFDTFNNSEAGIDELAVSLVVDKLHFFANEQTGISTGNTNDERGQVAKDSRDHKIVNEKTMRIPEKALDEFLRSVGELLGIEEMLRHLQRRCLESTDTSQLHATLKEAIGQFEAISGELRSRIMEIRKVEAKVLLQKVPRLVRDIASEKNKQINVKCEGETVAIDKSYVDILDAPLTHMVRNAADHGIELPDDRLKKKKDMTGTISVSMVENEDVLRLIVQDDGAGLNYEGIQKKAAELGIIEKNSPVSTDQITELLFYSGVSTATEVTDISGRGVGMDIVKKAITDAGGKIEVSSEKDKGTTFIISLPKNASTQIMDGYVVESFAGEIFVVPLNNVIEAFKIEPEQVNKVAGKGEMIQRRGGLNPLYLIDNLLGFESTDYKKKELNNCMGVLVETKNIRSVIAVKDIIGIQKVVSKKIEGGLLKSTQFDGAAVSGTGQIYMIVNVEKLFC